MSFLFVMLTYADIQRKVQQEIGSAIGFNLPPELSDMPDFLYLSAIVTENPITAAAGGPYLTTDEGVYEGYYIPKGSMILANSYAMLHDENIFPNPTDFKPKRFTKSGVISGDVLDPGSVAAFGFGRRRVMQ
ncbi:cytochrome P450 [Macrolepiota fuliginosa MF-IS2]|uniref:Cytochrome P450 n=1 Tax=Macrolepiota fuliginosa MF-IS2 TaxID=1400762 RepID=A0A9P6C337_9AGAR|nr:cytochrome P450 [Macrolepiota fuliginosa MF-IS2]